MKKTGFLVLALCLLAATPTLQLAIECPAYIEGLFDENQIVEKFAKDIGSGIVKSIHSK